MERNGDNFILHQKSLANIQRSCCGCWYAHPLLNNWIERLKMYLHNLEDKVVHPSSSMGANVEKVRSSIWRWQLTLNNFIEVLTIRQLTSSCKTTGGRSKDQFDRREEQKTSTYNRFMHRKNADSSLRWRMTGGSPHIHTDKFYIVVKAVLHTIGKATICNHQSDSRKWKKDTVEGATDVLYCC